MAHLATFLLNRNQTLGLLRHLVTFIGGILVARGRLDPTAVEALAGAIVTIVGVVLSATSQEKQQAGSAPGGDIGGNGTSRVGPQIGPETAAVPAGASMPADRVSPRTANVAPPTGLSAAPPAHAPAPPAEGSR